MILSLLAQSAFACGGLVPSLASTSQLAASDALQAILDIGSSDVTVDYRVHYTGSAEDFAWIIPVPGEVLAVEEGDDARFDDLAALTAPTVRIFTMQDADEGDGGGFGCLGARSKNDALAGGLYDSAASDNGGLVTITGQGYAGDYSYTIVSAEDSAAFGDWLSAQGYDLTYAAGPIAEYVADPTGFQWVTVQLRPDVPTTPEGGVNLSPLRIRYGAARGDDRLHAIYPSRMGASIQLSEVRTELFVVADGHAVAGNGWTTNTDMYLNLSEGSDPAVGYADFLRSVGGDQRGLVEVWQGPWTDEAGNARVLTRFDSITAPSVNTADIAFASDGDADVVRALTIDVGAYYYGGLVPLGLLGVAGLGWSLRRKR